jgi:hypothetical protein
VNATSGGGEVDALDPGAYGSFTISHAITIEGQGWSYVAPPSNGNAITITANAGDKITIHGVSLNGVGAANSNGIVFNAGGSLTVTDCVVQNFSGSGSTTGEGILIQPVSGTISFVITNSIFSNNGVYGISYHPQAGSATANGAIDHVVVTNNGNDGVEIDTHLGGGSTTVAISNSIASNNGGTGIYIDNLSAALAVSIDNTSSNGNANGIAANGTSKVTLGRSVITANSFDGIYNATSPNTFYSYLDNRINENGTDINSPLSPLAPH